jgi:hypothetical protein
MRVRIKKYFSIRASLYAKIKSNFILSVQGILP